MFNDRMEAGKLLAMELKKIIGKNEQDIILAVPRGGVPVAYAVANVLNLPVEIVLTKKIGHPMNKEYAIGAVSLEDCFIIPHEDVSEEYVEEETRKIRSRLREMYQRFMGGKHPQNIQGKTVIVIDDGIATGNTLLATVRLLRKQNPQKIIVASPVASWSAVQKLKQEADEVVVLLVPQEFYGVGSFYRNFEQVDDEEVIYYLDKIRAPKKIS
ncbi:MAG: phosphoribosyltransferase [Bacteroidetes bacterium]|nr:phosphoribosyltransferase [Bacteroidota bacterium]